MKFKLHSSIQIHVLLLAMNRRRKIYQHKCISYRKRVSTCSIFPWKKTSRRLLPCVFSSQRIQASFRTLSSSLSFFAFLEASHFTSRTDRQTNFDIYFYLRAIFHFFIRSGPKREMPSVFPISLV